MATGDPRSDESPADGTGDAAEALRCDFCGAVASEVRRVALDGDYERLRTRHQVRYACPTCSDRKEAERRTG